ncbi:hypothetical protein Dthio_PD0752 [Desulfonatronospira thiodismutans ASO3-1]|uniref:Integrase DNA-binding domain-containing protein n=1 Tax=Desulfonatronospira thiodismutans ASO3-1 TaxID=555779 RepID=D6SRV3_9BACT|nr:Arm DNA-binding domain-containing protein [Desulfonatronospira thiodismutans]EFI33419.1 hypothetical protein Dthio_PD0752 [Desulfonatronospira thiodismutans ASO3-1]
MPRQNLTPKFVTNPPKPTDKPKTDYFDTQVSGFILEVRSSGKATYYLRYRDVAGQLKQVKLGTPETLSLDGARSRVSLAPKNSPCLPEDYALFSLYE